jgi:DNA polymerase-1
MIVDADLKAIEWRVEADLCNVSKMIDDLWRGVDPHNYACTELMELDLTDANRNDAKIFNFRAIYVEQANAAYAYYMDTKMPAFSKKKWGIIIDRFFEVYPEIDVQHQIWVNEVRKNGQLVGPTGRIWKFDKVQKRGYMDYSVSQIYNYPVQGSAGDIIKLCIVKIAHDLRKYNMKALMCNTVHDSIIFDSPESEVQDLGEICVKHFRKVPEYLLQYFNWELKVPIDGEVQFGPSWGDMKELKL